MSYSTPVQYAAHSAPKLGVPAMLGSDDLLHFKGARSVLKYIPAATGSAVGPSSSVLFQIPQSPFGFIKPNSMYLRCLVKVTGGSASAGNYGFAGQNKADAAPSAGVSAGPGGASSIINRITVTFPGGIQMSYPMYNHFRNSILPHTLSQDFIERDLAQLESATVVRAVAANDTADSVSKNSWVTIPLDIPVFNSGQAFPLCLLSGGVTLEFVTETLVRAFWADANAALTTYAISDMALIYDELVVGPEFKSALVAASSATPFSIAVNDRLFMGNISASASSRTNFGIGLASLKAVIGTFQLDSNASAVTDPKRYMWNNLNYWNLFINGQQITPSNMDNDAQVFAEFQRSLQTYNDSYVTSYMIPTTNVAGTTLRTNYTTGQFAYGCSTACYSDAAFALSGIPADQVQIEFNFYSAGSVTAKWGQPTGGTATANATAYIWALHDSVVTILPDGTVSIRK